MLVLTVDCGSQKTLLKVKLERKVTRFSPFLLMANYPSVVGVVYVDLEISCTDYFLWEGYAYTVVTFDEQINLLKIKPML